MMSSEAACNRVFVKCNVFVEASALVVCGGRSLTVLGVQYTLTMVFDRFINKNSRVRCLSSSSLTSAHAST